MKPLVYIHQEQVISALGFVNQYQKGVAFEWKDENVYHLHIKTPKVAPSGYPSLGLFYVLSPSQEFANCESLIYDFSEKSYNEDSFFYGKIVFIFLQQTKEGVSKKGYIKDANGVQECEICYIPSKSELYSRSKGLLEIDILENKKVLIIGLGSFGSYISIELAKAGIGNFTLFDFDRIELSNIARHICGINELGRYKTHAISDAIKSKNPYAQVSTFEMDINLNLQVFREECAKSDLIICVTDENRSRSNINQIALELKKNVIFGRAITRAEGGDVFRLNSVDKDMPCLACLIGDGLFNYQKEEISTHKQADRDAPDYVSPEQKNAIIQVGLSSDIAPICNMIVKVALVELSKGLNSGIASLEDDLIANYYVWANRRENAYKSWSKLGYVATEPTILRWYGVRVRKNNECLVCNCIE